MQSATEDPWTGVDLSFIHPAHGLSFSQEDLFPPVLSQAEKLLASLECRDSDTDDQDASMIYGNEDEDSSGSDISLKTPLSFRHHSPTIAALAGSDFPFPATKSKSLHLAVKPPIEALKIPLQRVSSCGFSPRPLTDQESLTPVDVLLEEQLASTCSSASATPKASSSNLYSDFQESSAAMEAVASSSSSMMRSFSAPVHTQSEFDTLKKRWNTESAIARASNLIKGKQRAAAAGRMASTVLTVDQRIFTDHDSSSMLPARRSHDDLSTSSMGYDDEDDTSITGVGVSNPYSDRQRYLSPSKRHNPFKRAKTKQEVYTPFRSVASASSLPTIHEPDYARERSRSPPKATKPFQRPSLNRFFTMPGFSSATTSPNDSDG